MTKTLFVDHFLDKGFLLVCRDFHLSSNKTINNLFVTKLFLNVSILGGKTPDPSARTYKTIFKETALSNEEVDKFFFLFALILSFILFFRLN